MCFEVEAKVVERKVLVPGRLENVGGNHVIAAVLVLVAVGTAEISAGMVAGMVAGVVGAAGGLNVLFGSPIKTSDIPAKEQVLISAP